MDKLAYAKWLATLKHGKHNQLRHGYRYGKAPKLAHARRLRKGGTWEDYKGRVRGTIPRKGKPKSKPKPKKDGMTPKQHKTIRNMVSKIQADINDARKNDVSSGIHDVLEDALGHLKKKGGGLSKKDAGAIIDGFSRSNWGTTAIDAFRAIGGAKLEILKGTVLQRLSNMVLSQGSISEVWNAFGKMLTSMYRNSVPVSKIEEVLKKRGF